MSNRIGMICKLQEQKRNERYLFHDVGLDDIEDMSIIMMNAFKDTADYHGETLEELKEELFHVVKSTFGTFIPDASFQIKQNGEAAAVILISLYNEKPFISELFTNKYYLKQGMASALMKKSMSTLFDLGYKDIALHVHPDNDGAINLYKKIGFIESAEV